jgi:Predicted protein-tyrosine phosphatase
MWISGIEYQHSKAAKMRTTQIHPRIVGHPFASLVQGGLLSSYDEEGPDLVLDVQGLQVNSSELFEREEKIYERIVGERIPLRVRFSNITQLNRSDFFDPKKKFPQADSLPTIAYLLSWRQPKVRDIFHIIGLREPAEAGMSFFAQKVTYETQDNVRTSVRLERDWCPAPPMPDRLVPQPYDLYRRFGGDPITVRIEADLFRHRLFIGGLDVQSADRPQVDAVLNLGEEASRWVKGQNRHFNDRTSSKGEGSNGMTIAEIVDEAEWVIEHLKNKQRVLVHCVAGMNRSTTICCAALIMLEGLSAEAALERVREHHPWARPDSHHWLMLRWLASGQ